MALSPGESVKLIVNPVSGRGSALWAVGELVARFKERRNPVSVSRTACVGDARALAADAHSSRYGCLVVIGGDGTIHEVINGLPDSSPPIMLVPTGTENLMGQYLDLGRDIDRTWRVVIAGREIPIDLAYRNRERFLVVAGAGFDAEVIRLLELCRRGPITHLTYAQPILRAMARYRHPLMTVEADGQIVFEGRGLVVVGNVPRYAMGLNVHLHARPDDGLLDVCIFRCASVFQLARHFWRVILNEHDVSENVVYRQARDVRVSSRDPVPVELDGESDGWLPANFGLVGRQVRFLVGSGWRHCLA